MLPLLLLQTDSDAVCFSFDPCRINWPGCYCLPAAVRASRWLSRIVGFMFVVILFWNIQRITRICGEIRWWKERSCFFWFKVFKICLKRRFQYQLHSRMDGNQSRFERFRERKNLLPFPEVEGWFCGFSARSVVTVLTDTCILTTEGEVNLLKPSGFCTYHPV